MARFLDVINGVLTQLNPIASSSGVTDASKIPQTGTDGRLDATLMPATVSIQAKTFPASEDLTAGNLVNIWTDPGDSVIKVRKASGATSRLAVGFVAAGYLSGATATVYIEGINTQVSNLVPGLCWLGTAGAVIQTAPATGSGGISQIVGAALSATELDFQANDPIYLASA